MTATLCRPTDDGNWLARCLIAGTVASGRDASSALSELRRLLAGRRAA